MSRLIATFIFRWRYPLSALCVLGALVSIPSANITKIDNDITAWFSKIGSRLPGLRALSRGIRRHPQPDRGAAGAPRRRRCSPRRRSPTSSASPGTSSASTRSSASRAWPPRRWSTPCPTAWMSAVSSSSHSSGGPDAVRRRAVEDELIRGDLVSEDATVTALIVSFDEDRIDAVRGGVIQRIHDTVDPGLPPGIRAFYNGSLEISETYNRITLDNQQKFTPPILFVHRRGDLFHLPIVQEDAARAVCGGDQRLVDARPLLAARLQLQRPLQHDRPAHRRPGDCRRRAHHAALGRGAAARRRRAGVHQHRRAPDGAPARRQRHHGAGHAVAGDERRRGRAFVRHRVGGRHHGRLRHLARAHADAAQPGQAGDR